VEGVTQVENERHPIASLALLAERGRRDLYEFVRRANGPVTRDEAAASTGISRRLAAFHLDKLVHAGLLRAHTDRPAAGVGRRPKVYEPEPVELAVSVPARQYGLLAEFLVDAVAATSAPDPAEPWAHPADATEPAANVLDTAELEPAAEVSDTTQRERATDSQDATEPATDVSKARPAGDVVAAAARERARERGRTAGAQARGQARPGRLGPERALTLAQSVLESRGYEPARTTPRELLLRNCPFARLADRSRELVCGINHAFCSGIVAGLDAAAVDARLEPADGMCCVRLTGR
jgi:predicted ArsR family transcriptional regulator